MSSRKAKRDRAAIDWGLLPAIVTGLALVALPLVFSFTGLDKFRVPKDIVATLLTLAVFPWLWLTRRLLRPVSWFGWEGIAAALLVYVWLHTLLSSTPDVSAWSAVYLTIFVALYWVIFSVSDSRFQHLVWLGLAAAGAVNAILTIFQTHGLITGLIYAGGQEQVVSGRMNPAGVIGDVNSGGFLFGLLSLVLVAQLVTSARGARQVLILVLLVMNLTGLLYTQTLTATAALSVSLGLWLVFHHWWLLRHTRKVTRGLVILWAVLAVGAAGTLAVAVRAGLTERLADVLEQAGRGEWTTVTAGREPVYRLTWRMIQERPLLGRGLNTFGKEFFHFRAETEEGQSVRLIQQPGAFRETHNDYLQIWMELGLPGLLLAGGLFILALAGAWRSVRREPDRKVQYWQGVLAIGLVYVLVSALAFFPLRISLTGVFVMMLFAGIRRHQIGDQVQATGYSSARPLSGALTMAIMVLAVVLAGYTEVRRWSANNAMGTGAYLLEQSVVRGLPPQQRRMVADQVLARLAPYTFSPSRWPELHSLRGTAYLMSGRFESAVPAYQAAVAYIPSPELFTNLAAGYLAQQDRDRAREALEMALKYDSGYDKARQAMRALRSQPR